MFTYGSTTRTTNVELDGTEEWDYIRCTPPAFADLEITLPAVSTSNVGRRYTVRHVGTVNVVSLRAAGDDLIEGTSDIALSRGNRMTIQSFAFGSGWRWEIVGD